jgi:hypothetical protein
MWDIGCMILVLYDVIMIPFALFSPGESTGTTICQWIVRIFWSIDIPVSFCSGFVDNLGGIERHPMNIARRYFHTWLFLDLVVVTMEWVEYAFQDNDLVETGKSSSRIFKILRLIRLARLVKLGEIIKMLGERMSSEYFVIVVDIVKLFAYMIGISHIVACLWYALGNSNPEESWIIKYSYEDMPLHSRYIASMRWALSQFGGGMDEFTPDSFWEHLYAALVFMLCFWVGTVFIGILTSNMTQLYILGNKQTLKLNGLRRYLKENGVTKTLNVRVLRNAQHSMKWKQRSNAESTGIAELVSEPLQIELHVEMYYPAVKAHSFFVEYYEECPQVVMRVCHSAMTTSTFSAGDIVFTVGEAAEYMRFVRVGVAKYSFARDLELLYNPEGRVAEFNDVLPPDWISEASLWVSRWVHRGALLAGEDSIIVNLHADTFCRTVNQFEISSYDPSVHAQRFVSEMNKMDKDVSDLQVSRPTTSRTSLTETGFGFGRWMSQGRASVRHSGPHSPLSPVAERATSFQSQGSFKRGESGFEDSDDSPGLEDKKLKVGRTKSKDENGIPVLKKLRSALSSSNITRTLSGQSGQSSRSQGIRSVEFAVPTNSTPTEHYGRSKSSEGSSALTICAL